MPAGLLGPFLLNQPEVHAGPVALQPFVGLVRVASGLISGVSSTFGISRLAQHVPFADVARNSGRGVGRHARR